MKKNCSLTILLAGFLFFGGCVSQESKIIIHPEPVPEQQEETWQILESQNGPQSAPVPEWLSRFLDGGNREVESMGIFPDRYVFVGRMNGNNFNALRQWTVAFTVQQDLPRLIAGRIENRMVSAASLYPDDEYGDFFAALVKAASDAEYFDISIVETFWIKRRIETKALDENLEENVIIKEQYEFFILTSADKFRMQNKIRGIIESVKTPVSPTKEQATAINRIKRNFFEGF
jgi:hypothetical protein